ncbi:MAG: DUF1704 domain-containing protein, partial [bacterium]|nr:DUF1704 domain-containing protein [bacterium]
MQLTPAELEADRAIYQLSLRANATLTASNYEAERSAFFEGKENPEFVYLRVEHNSMKLKDRAAKIDIPDTTFGTLLRDKLNETIHFSEFIVATSVQEATLASQKIFGTPRRDILALAQQTIDASKDDQAMIRSLKIPAEQIITVLRQRLLHYGLDSWDAIQSHEPAQGIAVDSFTKQLQVQRGITDTLESKEMIVTHEVDTHVLCDENAMIQPTYLFANGLAGWLLTQEGLAAYNVTQQHAKDAKRPMFHWAMRAQAIDWALRGSFRDVYERLLALGLDKFYAFATAFKVKRGLPRVDQPGSYTRDHAYYTGLHR